MEGSLIIAGLTLIAGVVLVAFVIFSIYFIFKQLQFVVMSVNLYKKMVNRQDAMVQLLLDIRDNTKGYDPNITHAMGAKEESSGNGKIGIDVNGWGEITQVTSGGAASDAGIMEGDKILTINGKPSPVTNRDAIIAALSGVRGAEINLEVKRGSEQLSFVLRRR